jgi:hypothetical protein
MAHRLHFGADIGRATIVFGNALLALLADDRSPGISAELDRIAHDRLSGAGQIADGALFGPASVAGVALTEPLQVIFRIIGDTAITEGSARRHHAHVRLGLTPTKTLALT